MIYFALSKRIETPENHISMAAGRPSPPGEKKWSKREIEKETEKEEKRETEMQRERRVRIIEAHRTEVPVIFHNRDR